MEPHSGEHDEASRENTHALATFFEWLANIVLILSPEALSYALATRSQAHGLALGLYVDGVHCPTYEVEVRDSV